MTSLLPRHITRGAHPPRVPGGSAAEPTLDTWQDAPHNRWAFGHVSEFVPTAPIAHRPAEASVRPVLGLGRLDCAAPTG